MEKFVLWIKKIPSSICWSVTVIILILDALAFGFEYIIKKIKISQVAEVYDTFLEFDSNFVSHLQKYEPLLVIISICWVACLGLKFLYKKKMVLIKHFSLGEDYGKLSEDIGQKYKIEYLSITDIIADKPSQEYIRELDSKAKNIVKYSNSREIGYYGIAHIPFVFRIGFKINDQSKIHLFHRMRNNNAKYTELSHGEINHLSFSNDVFNKSKESDELVVAISTSYEITLDEIKRTFGNDKHIINFKLNNLGVDILTDYDEMENLAFSTWEEIRKKEKEYRINTLHIVMASSVAFALFMGKMCSPQIDAKTIVYHYQNGKYPWGVCMNENPENAIIITE